MLIGSKGLPGSNVQLHKFLALLQPRLREYPEARSAEIAHVFQVKSRCAAMLHVRVSARRGSARHCRRSTRTPLAGAAAASARSTHGTIAVRKTRCPLP